MANYQSQYTGAQIDEAVGKALSASGGGSGSSNFYAHFVKIENTYIGLITRDNESLVGQTLIDIDIYGTLKHTTAGQQYFYGGVVLGSEFVPTGIMFFFINTSNSTIVTKTISINATCESDEVVAI